MKRAPIVLAGSAAGLIGVVAYPTSSPSSAVSLAGTPGSTTTQRTSTASATSSVATKTAATASASTKTAASTAAAKTRTATGTDVSFQYGDLQVRVTKTGARVSNVTVVQLNANDPRSQSIDQAAVPQLQQEAMSAGSANIQAVSGASYTSAAYTQSLQSALDKLR